MALDPQDIREAYETDSTAWEPIRKEAKIDMQFVGGDPWDLKDREQRKDRPIVAPEEMGQYFNQVINQLRANRRGVKFSAVGNGANDATARFYENKAREIEYRSNAPVAFIQAAENAIQRGYGFVRVNTRRASSRNVNQELWIEGFPNPDMVLPPADSIRPDSSDAKRFFVFNWVPQAEFKRDYSKTKIKDFTDWKGQYPRWVRGNRILLAEYWQIHTTPRTLLLVQPAPPPMPRYQIAPPANVQALQPIQVFKDELQPGMQVIRELMEVDYPTVRMYLTNGIEILHEQDWPGKYIPIISCFGKVLYIEGDQGMERKILSMTRFGRDPWKAYCYACCQELEILGMTPKAPVHVWKGQLRDPEQKKAWAESPHQPKAWLESYHKDEDGQPYPSPPERIDYTQSQHLQAIEVVKEGFRRAIQAAMGSNFLPTQAQRPNYKSGDALDKMEQSASIGTFHFVDSFDGMIRQTGVIEEDLIPKIHDYMGEVGTIDTDGKPLPVRINDPSDPKSIRTDTDHLVTVSVGPSSDSERSAADDFLHTLIGNIQIVAGIAGQKPAAAVFAQGVRALNLGPTGDKIADLIEPPEYKQQDGQPVPTPREMAMHQEIQQLQAMLQKAAQDHQAKVVEQQGKMAVTQEQERHEDYRAAMDREVKLAVAAITAQAKQQLQDAALFYEERARVGAHLHEQAMGNREIAHNVAMAHRDAAEASHDRLHDLNLAHLGHAQGLEADQQAADLAAAPNSEAPPSMGATV